MIVHLRSIGDGCISETDDLNASTATYSAKNGRDIWSENTKPRLGDNTDIVVLRNSLDDSIMDAIMYVAEDVVEWTKGMPAMAEAVAAAGIYESDSVGEAEINNGLDTVVGRSFYRTDAEQLLQRVLAGEQIEYPVKRTSETWGFKKVSPGTL